MSRFTAFETLLFELDNHSRREKNDFATVEANVEDMGLLALFKVTIVKGIGGSRQTHAFKVGYGSGCFW